MVVDINALTPWIGRHETLHDQITTAPMIGMAATLDWPEPARTPDHPLPPLWHWAYFLPMARQSEIGPDGHPKRGGFLPPVPLPRRMWAGGRLQFHAPLHAGDAIERRSEIVNVSAKHGRSGSLVFVQVRHLISSPHGLAITEEHDIVYRDAPHPDDPAPTSRAAPQDHAWGREIHPDDVLLFRYSALTFNGHRIHYDRRYVTQVEGYPGLIVHGPLIATLLADLVGRQMPGAVMASFEFRALRPLFDIAPFSVCGKPSADGKTIALWAKNAEGWQTMEATARLA